MNLTFDQAFDRLIGNEGGYVFDLDDPGGETKWGISKRSYPMENIAELTVERARQIYLRDYWAPAGCDAAPQELKLVLFDAAVNQGVSKAIRMLQHAVHETEDGVLGPHTLLAVQSMPAARIVARFNGARLLFLADCRTWPADGRGWARRIATNLLEV